MAGRVIVPKVLEFTEHPWGTGQLTVNGVQYGTLVNTTTTEGTYKEMVCKTFNMIPLGYPGYWGEMKEVEVGLTVGLQSPDNATALIYWRLQGRELLNTSADKPWLNLSAQLTQVADCSTSYDNTMSGRVSIQANFNAVPFQLRVVANTNTADVGRLKVKNSSYVTYKYIMGME